MRLEGRPYPKQGQRPNLRPSSLQARQEADARNKATAFKQGVPQLPYVEPQHKVIQKSMPLRRPLSPNADPARALARKLRPPPFITAFTKIKGRTEHRQMALQETSRAAVPQARGALQELRRQSVRLCVGSLTLSRTARLQPNGRQLRETLKVRACTAGDRGAIKWRLICARLTAHIL